MNRYSVLELEILKQICVEFTIEKYQHDIKNKIGRSQFFLIFQVFYYPWATKSINVSY
jgi:hypothetical protein